MVTLHVRNVPDDLYEDLQQLAQMSQRSLSAQIVTMLENAVKSEGVRQEQAAIIEMIRRRRFTPSPGTPDPAAIVREGRKR